jgi:hypothetical protein
MVTVTIYEGFIPNIITVPIFLVGKKWVKKFTVSQPHACNSKINNSPRFVFPRETYFIFTLLGQTDKWADIYLWILIMGKFENSYP